MDLIVEEMPQAFILKKAVVPGALITPSFQHTCIQECFSSHKGRLKNQSLRGKVVTSGLEGRETLAGAYSRGLWR